MNGTRSTRENSIELDRMIENLLEQMTLDEKTSLLSGKNVWRTVPITRLGVPSLTMTDGPHGVRTADPLAGRKISPTTAFPTGVSLAASWNPELVEQVGAALGEEARAMGCDVLLGPCVNIVRHPLAGRNFESYSEDPYLAGKIGTGFVKGVQSREVGTSLKHFACNNQETERSRGSSEIDERTLREIYLAQFEMVVKEAKPWTVMCSYNRINGVYASENYYLMKEILKGEWDFDGVVVSDWGANHTTVESVQGGLDIEMPGPARYYGELLSHAVNTWQLDEADLNEAVRRILRLLARVGKLGKIPIMEGSANTPEHQALARQVAVEAITLLKNEAGILPLNDRQVKRVAVIGPNAENTQISGGGSSYVKPPYRISFLNGLRQRLASRAEVIYELGCNFDAMDPENRQSIVKAAALAKESGAAIVCVGMPEFFESEGSDRPHMGLPGPQNELISEVVKANPRTIVVINAGSPVEMPWIDSVPATLVAYYPGMEGGYALAEILFGDTAPSGKLPVTFPKRLQDTPAYINFPGTKEVHYGEGVFVGYRYYDTKDITPLFPFGHGLTYTSFEYSEIQVPEKARADEQVNLSVRVTNSGGCAGKETVQVYVHDEQASLSRPDKELKAFAKISLNPGESKVVKFTLEPRSFAYYDPYERDWVIEQGSFEILVGGSSRAIGVSRKIVLE